MAMASTRTGSMVASDLRIEFKTKEGIYKNLRDHRYSKPRGLPLLGKELSCSRITVVSVKDMQGLSEWLLFNSGRELYCYPFGATENVRVTTPCIYSSDTMYHTHIYYISILSMGVALPHI